MKKTSLLKLLINILILMSILVLVGLLINIPLRKCIMSPIKICIVDWNIFYWVIAIIGLSAYFFFIKSLYHLRKIAELLDNESLSDKINHFKKSGTCFYATGIIYSTVIILLWTYQAIETGKTEVGYDMDLIPPLFLIIIGLFFRKISSLRLLN